MNPEQSDAEQVRGGFAAEIRPEPPTDRELMALARGRFDVIDAEAVAEALALDPGAQRRYEEVQRFLERRSASLAEVPAARSLLDLATEWIARNGGELVARVGRAGSALIAGREGGWMLGSTASAPALTTRGFAPSDAGRGGVAPVVLKDRSGRTARIVSGPAGYMIEFDLNAARQGGFLTVKRVLLHGSADTPFEQRVLLRGGRGTLTGCPSGMFHVEAPGFEMYLLLEDVEG